MAAGPDAIRITRWRGVVLGRFWRSGALLCARQVRISLSQLGFRTSPDFSATYAGQKVIVGGVVSTPAFHFSAYSTLAIQDGRNGGVLKCRYRSRWIATAPERKSKPRVRWSCNSGMTMVEPEKITVLGRTSPPQPKDFSLRELQSTVHLGELVRIQVIVQEIPAYNLGGALILLPGVQEPYRLFIPRPPGADRAKLDSIHKGDTIAGHRSRVAIFCRLRLTTRDYELLVADIGDILPIQRSSTVPSP